MSNIINQVKIILILCPSIFLGCNETPPAHCANWWYYWRDGSVVDDMARVKYLWGQDPPKGISAPEKIQNLVGVSDRALAMEPSSISVRNKYESLSFPSVTIIAINSGGINGPAETIAHEFKHVWVYQQWGCRISQTGMVNGNQHTDTDAIPDTIESDRTAGSIGGIYHLHHDDPDTFDVQRVGWIGNPQYNLYGDNELLARVEGITNPRATHPELDWSEGGAQWGQ